MLLIIFDGSVGVSYKIFVSGNLISEGIDQGIFPGLNEETVLIERDGELHGIVRKGVYKPGFSKRSVTAVVPVEQPFQPDDAGNGLFDLPLGLTLLGQPEPFNGQHGKDCDGQEDDKELFEFDACSPGFAFVDDVGQTVFLI